jgi:small-conductance mechanosensitive channel
MFFWQSINYTAVANFLLYNALYTLAVLVLMYVSKTIVGSAIAHALRTIEDDDPESISRLEQRADTLAGLAKSIAGNSIGIIGFIIILSRWGINIAPILTGAGILGLAVGFGAQTLVKDLVNGFFIIFEDQFNVGDKVEIAKTRGRVVKMSMRTTTVRSEEGEMVAIPNSQIDIIKRL